jgi:hypothetical protein
MQRVEHREITLAGHAENVIDALDQKLVDENAGTAARGHVKSGFFLAGRKE